MPKRAFTCTSSTSRAVGQARTGKQGLDDHGPLWTLYSIGLGHVLFLSRSSWIGMRRSKAPEKVMDALHLDAMHSGPGKCTRNCIVLFQLFFFQLFSEGCQDCSRSRAVYHDVCLVVCWALLDGGKSRTLHGFYITPPAVWPLGGHVFCFVKMWFRHTANREAKSLKKSMKTYTYYIQCESKRQVYKYENWEAKLVCCLPGCLMRLKETPLTCRFLSLFWILFLSHYVLCGAGRHTHCSTFSHSHEYQRRHLVRWPKCPSIMPAHLPRLLVS